MVRDFNISIGCVSPQGGGMLTRESTEEEKLHYPAQALADVSRHNVIRFANYNMEDTVAVEKSPV